MAKSLNIEELLEEVRRQTVERSALLLKKRMNGESIESDELKELNTIKKELKFIEKTYAEMNGGKKVGGVESLQDLVNDFLQKAKSMKPTVGNIVLSNK